MLYFVFEIHAHTRAQILFWNTKSESLEVGPTYVYLNKPTRSFWSAAKIRKTGLVRSFSPSSSRHFMMLCSQRSHFMTWFKILKYYRCFSSWMTHSVHQTLASSLLPCVLSVSYCASASSRKLVSKRCVISLHVAQSVCRSYPRLLPWRKTMTSAPWVKDP